MASPSSFGAHPTTVEDPKQLDKKGSGKGSGKSEGGISSPPVNLQSTAGSSASSAGPLQPALVGQVGGAIIAIGQEKAKAPGLALNPGAIQVGLPYFAYFQTVSFSSPVQKP